MLTFTGAQRARLRHPRLHGGQTAELRFEPRPVPPTPCDSGPWWGLGDSIFLTFKQAESVPF